MTFVNYLHLASLLLVIDVCGSVLYAIAANDTEPRIGFKRDFVAMMIVLGAVLFGGSAVVLGLVQLVTLCRG